ncbi:MAG: cytochrome c biogenesis protein CcsA [Chloroflexi bacterium]|nr:cytochrome c biogenesis protein CcsA [Chloroflexota bacterium]
MVDARAGQRPSPRVEGRAAGLGWGVGALLVATAAVMVVALYMALVWAPPERLQGQVYRIFFFHVPVSWVAYLAFAVTFAGGLAYLRSGRASWDRAAAASAEVGVVFTTLSLVTGSIWGKPILNAWWGWDVRLTTTLVLWLIYLGYLMIRAYAAEQAQGARLAAVVGVVGFVVVPINFFSIRLWRGLHPGPNIGTEGGLEIEGAMAATLFVSLAAVTLLYITLLVARIRLRSLTDAVGEIKARLGVGGIR